MRRELPSEFQIIGPDNVSVYRTWYAKAMRDASTRRFILSEGFFNPVEDLKANTWSRMLVVSDRIYAGVVFDHANPSSAQPVLFVLGAPKQAAAARGIRAIAWIMETHSCIERVISHCLETNAASFKLHSKIFGAPWGIEPSSAWDCEEMKFVSKIHFAMPMREFLRRCNGADAKS